MIIFEVNLRVLGTSIDIPWYTHWLIIFGYLIHSVMQVLITTPPKNGLTIPRQRAAAAQHVLPKESCMMSSEDTMDIFSNLYNLLMLHVLVLWSIYLLWRGCTFAGDNPPDRVDLDPSNRHQVLCHHDQPPAIRFSTIKEPLNIFEPCLPTIYNVQHLWLTVDKPLFTPKPTIINHY